MKIYFYITALALIIASCNQNTQKGNIKLEQGTPSYETAKKLAEIYPFLDPDINYVFIDANSFTVTTGDIVGEIDFFLPMLIKKMVSDVNQKEVRDLVYTRAKLIAQKKTILISARNEGLIITSETIDSLVSKYRIIGVERSELKDYLVLKGKTIEYLKIRAEEDELYRRFMHFKLKGKVEANEQEVRNAYNNSSYLNMHYIFISTINLDDKKKKDKIVVMSRVQELIHDGFSFDKLAEKYSENSISTEDNGYVTGVYRGQFTPKIDSVIFELSKGDVSNVIETNEGLYIFQIDEYLKDTRSFEDAYMVYKSQVERDKRIFAERELTKELIEKEELQYNNILY